MRVIPPRGFGRLIQVGACAALVWDKGLGLPASELTA